MSCFSEEEYEKILSTVKIIPVEADEVGNIAQYSFNCKEAEEYVSFLQSKAIPLSQIAVTKTFVVIHRITNELIGYFSMVADTIKLTTDEKVTLQLDDVEFMSLPAIKLGKLAINKSLSKEAARKGYGSFILDTIDTYAFEMLELGVACRFITVDADLEYENSTPEFYKKNGFEYSQSRKRKESDKTVSMYRDIFRD